MSEWSPAEQKTLRDDVQTQLRTILAAETGLSNRGLVLADWLLDMSSRPAGRIIVSLVALSGAWALL